MGILTKTLFFKKEIFYFYDTKDDIKKADMLIFLNFFNYIPNSSKSKTYIDNLSKYNSIDNLYQSMNPTTRNAINRSKKENNNQ